MLLSCGGRAADSEKRRREEEEREARLAELKRLNEEVEQKRLAKSKLANELDRLERERVEREAELARQTEEAAAAAVGIISSAVAAAATVSRLGEADDEKNNENDAKSWKRTKCRLWRTAPPSAPCQRGDRTPLWSGEGRRRRWR